MSESPPSPGELAETHAGFVLALALRLAPAPGLAEDIAQQVWLEFLSKAGKDSHWDLTTDVKPLLAGMTRIVASRMWREKTHQRADTVRELAEHIRELAEAQDLHWYTDEEKSALRRCLTRLPDKSRELIKLHYELDMTSVEIGHQTDTNAEAVRRALFRLRGNLRQCIQRLLGEKGEKHA